MNPQMIKIMFGLFEAMFHLRMIL